VQVVCGSPAFANAACGIGKPVSVHCATRAKVERRRRDANPVAMTDWWRRFMTEVTDRVDDQVLRSADAIQVMNEWLFEYASKLNAGREVDVRYAPPGIDTRTFRPAGDRNLDRDPFVLCVGRLDDPRKNIDLLLDAYLLLPAELRSAQRLVLAGSAAPPESFWARVESVGLTSCVGFVSQPSSEELVALYQNASMFVLPSDEEGFGVVLLEAMACGIPVVSTRSGGPDGIITDGVDGYLVACGDAAAMSDRIAQLHRDAELNRAMGRRCRATAERRFSEDSAGKAFLDVWESLLGKSGRVWQCAV